MALILKKLYYGYYWLFNDLSDPRSTDLGLYLMSSPLQPITVIALYLYFVYNIGPKFMENRKPYNLKNVIIGYNVIQIILNCYIIYEAAYNLLFYLSWDCAPIDYSYSPEAIHHLKVYYLFFIIKMADLLDTVFFILRKNYRQVTFLHVYHHFGMVLMLWIAVKFTAGGHGAWIGLINSTVHVVMYAYYTLTAIDEAWKKNLKLKRFITQIQMVQFLSFIIIYGRIMFKSDCDYPKIASFFFVPQNVFMFLLFADFYRKAYLKKKPKPIESSKKLQN